MSNLVLQGVGNPPVATSAMAINLPQLEQMAGYIVSSNFFGIKRKEEAITLMLLCLADGLNPIEAVRRYHIINGRPTMKSEAMLAEFQKAGGSVKWVVYGPECVTGEFLSADGSAITLTWDKAKAAKADLWGKTDTWRKYPDAMLRNRCISEAIRAVAPGVTNGIYTEDEAIHMPPPVASNHSQEVRQFTNAPAALPPAPPKVPPLKRFIERAGQLSLKPPAVTPDGKLSKTGALPLLCEIYGTEVTTLSAPEDHAAWEGHLAALLAVYPEAPADRPQPPIEELSDPFADEGDS